MKKIFTIISMAVCTLTVSAQTATVTIHANQGKSKICKEIYGQFTEHLGT